MNIFDKKSISSKHSLHKEKEKNKPFVPIVYDKNYSVNLKLFELIHPFDGKKYEKIDKFLEIYLKSVSFDALVLDNEKLIFQRFPQLSLNKTSPSHPITNEELSLVHSKSFIWNINWNPITIANTFQICLMIFVPICMIRSQLINPIKWQTSGSILGGFLAMKYGWAINIGGGFHNCSAENADVFCLMADITLTIRYLWQEVSDQINVLIVDLDAHQGMGYARDVLNMTPQQQKQIYILDAFNYELNPKDGLAKIVIDKIVNFDSNIKDSEYLSLIDCHLKEVLTIDKFKPHIIIYNAGTDLLVGDKLGRMNITPEGILKRDEMVFNFAKENKFSILMLLSGGYHTNSAKVIANSIQNLFDKNIIKPIE